jgi:hypothetical protein
MLPQAQAAAGQRLLAQTRAPLQRAINHSRSKLTAYISVRSLGGLSLFAHNTPALNSENISEFLSDRRDVRAACVKIQDKGFQIDRVGRLNIRISAPAQQFESKLGVKFERNSAAGMWIPSQDSMARLLNMGAAEVEGMVFPEPAALHGAPPAPTAAPPKLPYHHILAPAGIARAVNALPVHAQGNLGQNVRAAMIDSGFQWSHPYFRGKGYNLKVAHPDGDDSDFSGHGTGESANFLAVAPRACLYGLAMHDLVEAIQIARDELAVQIISNSWGSGIATDGPNGFWTPYWKLVEAEIALCVQEEIAVLFSAGNGHVSFTASMPETISIGGVHIDENGAMLASDYASSFRSTRYPGSQVPDVCALTGMKPKAIYITLPVPAGCEIDANYGGRGFPNFDETGKKDGWAVFSGTSAACPMAAGVAALVLSKYPDASPAEVRRRLCIARDVIDGVSAMGDPAGPGYDPCCLNQKGHRRGK